MAFKAGIAIRKQLTRLLSKPFKAGKVGLSDLLTQKLGSNSDPQAVRRSNQVSTRGLVLYANATQIDQH